jgi:aminopeptidase N
VAEVRIDLDLTDPTAATFGSTTSIRFASVGPETFVDFRGHELVRAELNGLVLDPSAWREGRIALSGLAADNTLTVSGRMAYRSDGEGLHRHVDPGDEQPYLYAMSFLDAGPWWFAGFDQPDLKAAYTLDVWTPEGWTVLGNGPGRRVGPGRWSITPAGPLPSYLITLVAGPYASVTGKHRGIRLGLHARASLRTELEAAADDLLTVTGQALDYYADLFDRPYPFGEYHQAFVPDFNAGAMENPGCVTLRDTFLHRGRTTRVDRGQRAGVVAHELAHMWFGDLVTMRWWDDLWLNESFAEYLAHRCRAAVTDYPLLTEFGAVRKDWGAVADQAPTTHPVAGNDAADAETALEQFDGISYAKGAAVLRQLAAYLGEDVFLAGLRRYIRRYAWGNATFTDLLGCWVEAGAVDLEPWARAWLRTVGMDTLDVEARPPTGSGHVVAGSDRVVAVLRRPAGGGSDRPHALRVVSVAADGSLTPVADVTVAADPVPLTLPADSVLLVPDGTDAAWAKIRFGPDGWSRLGRVLPAVTDELVRGVALNAIRDAVRDAELDPAAALDLLLAAVPGWSDETLVEAGLGFAIGTLAGPYASVGERPGRLGQVADVTEGMLAAGQEGSDQQLVAFRLYIRSTTDVLRLRDWARGGGLPAGIALDPDLLWLAVRRLAALEPDPAPIDAASALDRSAAGRIHAIRAWAMLGRPETKAAAWARLMQPSELSAYELYATAEGFFVPGQEDLTDPYVDRYFAEIGATGAFRSGWALREVAAKAYPWLAATPETVRRAEQTLAGDLPGPVRRALLDGTDKLARAVRSLDRFR